MFSVSIIMLLNNVNNRSSMVNSKAKQFYLKFYVKNYQGPINPAFDKTDT
jgi:hypothetical protein